MGQYTPLSDFMLKYGAAVSFNVGKNLQFGGSFLMGSEDLRGKVNDGGDVRATKFELSGVAGQAYVRWYPMAGTFSLNAGVGYRQANAEYRIESGSSNLFITGELTIQSVVVPVFVGNHWFFDNGLFFGCDWIGAYIPLTGSSTAKSESNVGAGDGGQASLNELNDDLKKLGDDLAKKLSLTLLVLGIGYQF